MLSKYRSPEKGYGNQAEIALPGIRGSKILESLWCRLTRKRLMRGRTSALKIELTFAAFDTRTVDTLRPKSAEILGSSTR